MAGGEFDLIHRHFRALGAPREDVVVGVGDDCALLRVPPGQLLAVSLDTLVAGTHFLADADPEGVGHKALAVNLSDLAAMGAEPAWFTLGLCLPERDDIWLGAFCRGMAGLAERAGVALVGGDTTRGPLSLSIEVHGFVPEGVALGRDGARPGHRIFVTGVPGEAALGLAGLQGRAAVSVAMASHLRGRLERPEPRVDEGMSLRGVASAAIDVSDGLAQDLGHLLEASGVGAVLEVDRLPRSPALDALERDASLGFALTGGDDYELCFTVAPERLGDLARAAARWRCACTEIGRIEAGRGLRLRRSNGAPWVLPTSGWDHFIS